ncbi:TetR/AcrR family transcriptional regulator [Nocardioides piscis]|uniref:TetR family transcriptional regulator n=1 Tax=Nocardioides piscis TaxID=2714938 RepID=A0A6G7YIP8_9ACTN|nr:TetR-like C-terminal domain-containing protein [Nocardioides piscis]QIK76609.1 TetR family transcriptional regulator [Nocardioides piscis]
MERYHHGDLREALVQAGFDAARELGADAIALRDVTRRVGVTPRAAYRHFEDRQALVLAVARRAAARLAAVIDARIALDPEMDAATRLESVGLGYIAFALDEPGLFDAAFFAIGDMLSADAPEAAAAGGRTPYQHLQDALDRLVAAGDLPAASVGDAAIMCWSGVHGFATLTARGPLRALPREVVDEQACRLVGAIVEAVTASKATLA